ncbi:MAG: S-layer homology domain-containing protein [Firmicutes bacterium]|nr:S-layer homology domain-containing protein [Bacillota bacterium]
MRKLLVFAVLLVLLLAPALAAGAQAGGGDDFTLRLPAETESDVPVQVMSEPPELSDVSGHWAREYITKLYLLGIVSGYPDGSFQPDNQITRGEFSVMAARAFSLVPPAAPAQVLAKYRDAAAVPGWCRAEVAACTARNILRGYLETDGTWVKHYITIPREQVAAILSRYACPDLTPGPVTFADAGAISDWAVPEVGRAAAAGLVTGYPDGTFRPQQPVTRAEAAVLIFRTMQYQHLI